MKWGVLRCLAAMAVLGTGVVRGQERVWDEAQAGKLVDRVLAVEKSGQPWNKIDWRTDPVIAAAEAKNSGKPILVFFHVARRAPEAEPC